MAENFKGGGGARWKVRGSPGAGAGLDYLGENLDEYKRRYQIKSEDSEKSWKELVNLCRVLNQTPLDQLEKALEPILDIDGALKFLALDVALSNSDGYWIRASDYSIARDGKGKFHIIPHDMNEAFQPGMGFPFGGKKDKDMGPKGGFGEPGPRVPSFGPEPLVALDDARKPLRSRLLAAPSLRARYLSYVRLLAEEGLDWRKLGPVVASYRALLDTEVQAETRKLMSLEAFRAAVADAPVQAGANPGSRPTSLRAFADGRREYLLNHPSLNTPDK
jgi:hypothetical protein